MASDIALTPDCLSDSAHVKTTRSPDWNTEKHSLLKNYPNLANLNDKAWDKAIGRAQRIEIPADTIVYDGSIRCNQFVLLLNGSLRVYHVAPDGREMTLYRIEPGDLCVLSLTSLMDNVYYNVLAKTDTPIKALGIEKDDFNYALAESSQFRNFVISTLSGRLCDLMFLIQDTAFQTVQVRLACLLLKMFAMSNSTKVDTTHQNLAQEIGTSREVISRILKDFEHDNCIQLSRGHIELRSLEKLDKHAHPEKYRSR